MVQIEATDRYGGNWPDPATACKGEPAKQGNFLGLEFGSPIVERLKQKGADAINDELWVAALIGGLVVVTADRDHWYFTDEPEKLFDARLYNRCPP